MTKIKSFYITKAENGFIVEIQKDIQHKGPMSFIQQIINNVPQPGDEWKKNLPNNVEPAPDVKPVEVHIFPTQEEMLTFLQKLTLKFEI